MAETRSQQDLKAFSTTVFMPFTTVFLLFYTRLPPFFPKYIHDSAPKTVFLLLGATLQ